MLYGLRKKWDKKQKKKKIFPECRILALGEVLLPRVPCSSTRETFLKKIKQTAPSGRDVNCRISSSSVSLSRVLHSGKRGFSECQLFSSVRSSAALGKAHLLRVFFFTECFPSWHSRKSGFSECPTFGTREISFIP